MKQLSFIFLLFTLLQTKDFTFTDQIGKKVSIQVPVKMVVVI